MLEPVQNVSVCPPGWNLRDLLLIWMKQAPVIWHISFLSVIWMTPVSVIWSSSLVRRPVLNDTGSSREFSSARRKGIQPFLLLAYSCESRWGAVVRRRGLASLGPNPLHKGSAELNGPLSTGRSWAPRPLSSLSSLSDGDLGNGPNATWYFTRTITEI